MQLRAEISGTIYLKMEMDLTCLGKSAQRCDRHTGTKIISIEYNDKKHESALSHDLFDKIQQTTGLALIVHIL